MSECTHTIKAGGKWEPNPYYDPNDERYEGEEMVWVPEWDKSTTVDVDLHHYKCTQCGKVMPYCQNSPPQEPERLA